MSNIHDAMFAFVYAFAFVCFCVNCVVQSYGVYHPNFTAPNVPSTNPQVTLFDLTFNYTDPTKQQQVTTSATPSPTQTGFFLAQWEEGISIPFRLTSNITCLFTPYHLEAHFLTAFQGGVKGLLAKEWALKELVFVSWGGSELKKVDGFMLGYWCACWGSRWCVWRACGDRLLFLWS